LPGIFLLGALVVVAASGCGGGDGSVEVTWERRADDAAGDPNRQSTYATVVYVNNDSGATLRDARLRFRPNETPDVPMGFSVGTITNVATSFEGSNHVWPIGDLKSGTRLVFPLQLWFSSGYGATPDSVELRMELVSPDLEGGALESKPLTLLLNR
jgi:hypothetical protein